MAGRAIKTRAPTRGWEEAESDLKRDQIYEQLLLDIVCGDLAPGERIDEASLADRYEVGRAGMREALYRLSLEGLVERRPRLGTAVVGIQLIELQQVFHLRVQMEGQCAALAARNARPQDLVPIRNAFADADAIIARKDWRALVQCDRNFHQAVANAAHNRWLSNVVVSLHTIALRFWYYALPRRPAKALHKEIAYHLAIVQAIEKRDPEAAQQAMMAVLGEFPNTVQNLFSVSLTEVQ